MYLDLKTLDEYIDYKMPEYFGKMSTTLQIECATRMLRSRMDSHAKRSVMIKDLEGSIKRLKSDSYAAKKLRDEISKLEFQNHLEEKHIVKWRDVLGALIVKETKFHGEKSKKQAEVDL